MKQTIERTSLQRRAIAGALCALLALCLGRSVRAEDPPTRPILQIETGNHGSQIKDLQVDAKETFFATCSQDGTVRIWDLVSGESQRVLRVPHGGSSALYSVAISPDGNWIVAGGTAGYDWDKAVSIYVFERATGKLARRITGLPNATQLLRFSPDGKYLAAALAGNDGMRVFRFEDGKQVAEDKEYDLDCVSVAWRQDGVLAASGLDGFVRLYNPDFKLALRKKVPGGTHPHGLAFSPDGDKLAVGFGDTKSVSVMQVKDLSLLYSPKTDDLKLPATAFDSVAWSPDGKTLYAGGRAAIVKNDFPLRIIRRWENGGQGKFTDVAVGAQTVTSIVPLKLGPVLYSTADPAWGVLDGDKARVFDSPLIDMRLTSFLLSDDASTVQISTQPYDKATVRFNVPQRKLETGIADTTETSIKKGKADGLHAAIIEAPGLKVTDYENGMHVAVNGHPVALSPNEASRCIAILPDHKRFLLGGDFSLRLFDADGKQAWAIETPVAVWDLNVSKDGDVGVALLADGTVRWFKTTEPALLLSLFIHKEQKQWVAWTQSGLYDAAAGSEDLIGWNINRGKDDTADFFPASRFRSAYYRPDVVERVLKAGSEEKAVVLADADRGKKTEVVNVTEALPPILTIQSPENNTELSQPTVSVRFSVRTPKDAPVTAVRALVDGRPVGNARRIQETPNNTAEMTQTLDVVIPNQDCDVSLIAENKHGIGSPSKVHVRWKGKAAEDITKPKLYVLAVGVSKYKNPDYTLDYAAKDASEFAAAVQGQKGKIYRDVESRILTDDQAGKEALLDSLEWIQKQTTSRDVAMIFLAGHGVRDGSGDYYYVPYNFDNDHKRSTGVLFYEIEKTIKDIAGKVVFFVDTCHSGGASGKARGISSDIVSIVNELSSAENGAIVFAASTGKESALEDAKWGHGAFTKALLEGLGGKADLKGDGRITITSLDYFLSERVKELTGGSQHPTTTKPPSVPDFTIAVSK